MVHMDFHPGKPPWLPGIHFLHACHGYTTQGPRLLVSSNASSRHRNAVALWTHYGPYGCPPRKPPWLPGIHFLYAYHGYTAQCTRLLVSSIRSHCPSPDGQCLPANMSPLPAFPSSSYPTYNALSWPYHPAIGSRYPASPHPSVGFKRQAVLLYHYCLAVPQYKIAYSLWPSASLPTAGFTHPAVSFTVL